MSRYTTLLLSILLCCEAIWLGDAAPSTSTTINNRNDTHESTNSSDAKQHASASSTITHTLGSHRPFWRSDDFGTRPINPEQQQGRIVLANTREQGAAAWGVGASQAELACQRIARKETSTRSSVSPATGNGWSLGNLFESLLGGGGMMHGGRLARLRQIQSVAPHTLVGHLLSVSSPDEMESLMQMLDPLPTGAFWTGGKLVRRSGDQHSDSELDLKWNDGKTSFSMQSILDLMSMTLADVDSLVVDYVYCISFDFSSATWQARDCVDKLPYICRIEPKTFSFSNKVTTPGGGRGRNTNIPQTTEESVTGPVAQPPVSQLGVEQPGAQSPVAQPGVQLPVAQPVVEQPGAQSPVAQPGVQLPVVQPGVQSPIVQPGVQLPVAQPGVQPPVTPLDVQPPVVQPGLQQPEVQPGIQTPVVQPVLPQPELPATVPGMQQAAAIPALETQPTPIQTREEQGTGGDEATTTEAPSASGEAATTEAPTTEEETETTPEEEEVPEVSE